MRKRERTTAVCKSWADALNLNCKSLFSSGASVRRTYKKCPNFAKLINVVRHFKIVDLKILLYLLSVILLSSLSSCDPVHTLTLENSSNQTIEVCYYPSLELTQIGTKVVERIIIRGKEMDKVTLDS